MKEKGADDKEKSMPLLATRTSKVVPAGKGTDKHSTSESEFQAADTIVDPNMHDS